MSVHYSTLPHLPPLRSTVLEDVGIEHRTVATSALAVRRSNHSAIGLIHNSARSLIHNRLSLIHLPTFVMSMVRVIPACTAEGRRLCFKSQLHLTFVQFLFCAHCKKCVQLQLLKGILTRCFQL